MSTRAMALNREIEASYLQEEEIWFAIVKSFVKLEVPYDVKAEMLFSAVGNRLDIIEVALNYGIENHMFSDYDIKNLYDELIKVVLNYKK